ncbi:MAG: hypothetical protein ABIG92_00505 [Candidatus Omnitrophota bacterium]
MNKFKALFGIDSSQVKDTCILLPLIPKDLLKKFNITNFSRGKIYSSAENKFSTVIHTGIGPSLTGDCVLHLKNTGCKNVIILGSCGLTQKTPDLDVASLVMPDKCYAFESFSDMLLNDIEGPKMFYPDRELSEKFLEDNISSSIKKVTCATLASLLLEEGYIDRFSSLGIDVVDMECSALFSAASKAGLNAMALFYITDIINVKPFYVPLEGKEKDRLSGSISLSLDLIWKFIQKISSS